MPNTSLIDADAERLADHSLHRRTPLFAACRVFQSNRARRPCSQFALSSV